MSSVMFLGIHCSEGTFKLQVKDGSDHIRET